MSKEMSAEDKKFWEDLAIAIVQKLKPNSSGASTGKVLLDAEGNVVGVLPDTEEVH